MDSGTSWSKGYDKKTRDKNNRSRRVARTDTDSFRSESYSDRLWNLENRSLERNCIWLMKLNRYTNEIERWTIIHDLISDCQMMGISEYPSLKIRPYLISWRLWSLSLLESSWATISEELLRLWKLISRRHVVVRIGPSSRDVRCVFERCAVLS